MIHFPNSRVCVKCGAIDKMKSYSFRDKTASLTTFTYDFVAASESPPNVNVVIDFEGGGRMFTTMVDCSDTKLEVGTPVEMTYRRLFTIDGINTRGSVRRLVPIRKRGRKAMTHNFKDQVAVVGMGCSKFGARYDAGKEDLIVEAVKECLEDSGLELKDIDAFWFGTQWSEMAGVGLTKYIKTDMKPVSRMENFCCTGTDAFRNACYAVASGVYDVVMAIGMEKRKDNGYSGLASFTLFGRLGKPEEIANAAVFLASEESSYVTGIHLIVSGGVLVG
jgi:uncharacterized OB-fold protein